MKPKVKLTGTDGNVFALLGRCVQGLKKADQLEKAKELQTKVLSARSYDEALQRMMEYVDAY